MPDFFQHARLPTLHHLAETDLLVREGELAAWTKDRPLALLLPALYSEFQKPALARILAEIAAVPYISEVVISVNRATAKQIDKARAMCDHLLQERPFTILWNDGPALRAVRDEKVMRGLSACRPGKGSNIWMGLTYLLALGKHQLVASHDTDILSYERAMLWRLCYPVAHPGLDYHFAKGYYGRVGGRLYGRVTRLLVFPLIQAFIETLGRSPLLDFLESFRYPLSGEFSADLQAIGQFEISSGWGLEMCLLCESQERLKHGQICQVDLGFNFEHRHRKVSNATVHSAVAEGLVDSATEVARTLTCHLLESLKEKNVAALLAQVTATYPRIAHEWVSRYQHDALFNGLTYNAQDERDAVHVFAEAIDHVLLTENLSCAHEHHLTPAAFVRDHPDLAQQIVASA
jgi:glucosyl-3-phosphoglycerate synthase